MRALCLLPWPLTSAPLPLACCLGPRVSPSPHPSRPPTPAPTRLRAPPPGEGAYRVPLMVRWPGKFLENRTLNGIISHADWWGPRRTL